MSRRSRRVDSKVAGFLILLLILGPLPSYAFHFPWDQGHDTFTPNPPDDDTDPGPDNTCGLGSPFEVATGNFIYQSTDLAFAALGPDIFFVRTYNSKDMRSGGLGHGWSFTYDQRLVETTDGESVSAVLHEANGKREIFQRNADGSYSAPSHLSTKLTKSASGTFVLQEKQGTRREFDSAGRLVAVTDRNGNSLTFHYDVASFLTSIVSADGRSFTINKGPSGKIANLVDPFGRTVRYEYDSDGNLVRSTDLTGSVTSYTYDSKHNLVRIIDARGNEIQKLTYDSAGRVSSFLEQGQLWQVTYTLGQRKTTKTDSRGRIWTFLYDDNGNITREVDPLGGGKQYSFDANQNILGVTDANGHTVSYTYDSSGNVTSFRDALGNTTNYSYEQEFNQVATMVDSLGNASRYVYDSKGNLVNVMDARGGVEQFAYDSMGQLVQALDAAGKVTEFSYDDHGNLLRVTGPLGNSTVRAYDEIGNLTSLTDPEGGVTQYSYDLLNRPVRVVDALGGVTVFSYDVNGNVIELVDAKRARTLLTYDAFSRITKVVNPLGESRSFGYDVSGNLTSVTNGDGQTAKLQYDAKNRLIRMDMPGDFLTYTYDSEGNVLSASNNKSNVTFSYDAANRVAQARTGATAAQPATSLSYTYDAHGNRLSMIDPQGGRFTYAYDALGHLTRLTNPQGEATTFTYDTIGRRESLLFPNGIVAQTNYDAAGYVTQVSYSTSRAVLLQFGYTYDANGNRVSATDSAGRHTYEYDSLNRLTSASHPTAAAERFTYNEAHNRVASHLSSAYRYDTADRLLSDDQFDYSYDKNGNLVRKTDRSTGQSTFLTYDFLNQLVRIDFPSGSFANYAYDALGRRIEKNVNGSIIRYVYDRTEILLEYDATNKVVAEYTHTRELDTPISMSRNVGGDGTPESFFYHVDALGSIVAVTAADASVVRTYAYDSFGRTLSESGTIANPFTFAARELDSESGLLYYRARYYDPSIGRFLSEEPSWEDGPNPYWYALANPVNFVDPTGLGTAGAAIGGAIGSVLGGIVGGVLGGAGGATAGTLALPGGGTLAGGGYGAVEGATLGAAGGVIAGAAIGHGIEEMINFFSKSKGKENVRDTGLQDLSDEEVSRRARDKSLSGEERRKYQKEEKARKLRNKGKRCQ